MAKNSSPENEMLEHDPAKGDWFLQELVSIVNGEDFRIPITLNVGGFLISGSMVSGHKYFEGFSKDFVGALGDDEAADDIRQSFAKRGDIYTKEDAEDVQHSPSYIHIENAKFFNTVGGPIPSNKGVWWRGRIREVQGFALGGLSKGESS